MSGRLDRTVRAGDAVERKQWVRQASTMLEAGRTHADRDPEQDLMLRAAEVVGAAEAVVMVEASAAVARGAADPTGLVDETVFRASGMHHANMRSSHAFWVLWSLRRARAHLAEHAVDDDLVAAGDLLDAVHALLSGHVYRLGGGEQERRGCRKEAAERVTAVVERLMR